VKKEKEEKKKTRLLLSVDIWTDFHTLNKLYANQAIELSFECTYCTVQFDG
jgi:hypothetical protein